MKNVLTTSLIIALLSPGALADGAGSRALIDALMQDRDGEVSRVALALLGDRGGDSLFYLPTRDQPQTPARWDFAYEDVNFKSADGTFACYQDMARVFAGDLGGNITTNQWSPVSHVANLAPVPLLIVHGVNDEVVPFAQGHRLHAAAAAPKTLFKVEQGRHGDALTRDNGAYRRKTLAWLA